MQPNNELNYSEVAAALENIYKLSPAADVADAEGFDRKRRKDLGGGENIDNINVVRNRKRRARRLSLDKRVERKRRCREGEIRGGFSEKDEEEEEDVERLVREYSVSTTDLVSLDWRKMKIPPVLSSSEQALLFRLMQTMKAIFEVKENLHNDLNKEPTEGELAAAVNMTIPQLRRHIEACQAARNKLIKIRQEIRKAKLELMCELQRLPTEEKIISRVGISPERYHDVMKASKSVYSLNSRHVVTQEEEFINAITDIDGVGGDKHRQPALLRLALDDVIARFTEA